MPRPVPVLVTYRPMKGKESRFLSILKRHWPALRSAGLAAPTPPRAWRAREKRSGRDHFVETFSWKDAASSDSAHTHPDVVAIWGPMMPLLESMEIAVVEELGLGAAARAPAGGRRPRRALARPARRS
jgi:hypothetical protein